MDDRYGENMVEEGPSAVVDPVRFAPLLERVENGQLLLIDIRDQDEFRAGRITGAINCPMDRLDEFVRGMDHEAHLAIYCKAGKRCIKAAVILKGLGFNNLTILDGGIEAWNREMMLVHK